MYNQRHKKFMFLFFLFYFVIWLKIQGGHGPFAPPPGYAYGPCAIKAYIKKRLHNSDLEAIMNCTNLNIAPTSYALLQKAQPTSAAVERSFSMLGKLLRKDRNFDVKNVKKYMMLYYNK